MAPRTRAFRPPSAGQKKITQFFLRKDQTTVEDALVATNENRTEDLIFEIGDILDFIEYAPIGLQDAGVVSHIIRPAAELIANTVAPVGEWEQDGTAERQQTQNTVPQKSGTKCRRLQEASQSGTRTR